MNKIIKRSVKNTNDFVQLVLAPMIETGYKGVETIHVSLNDAELNILQIRFIGIQDKKLADKVMKSIRVAIDLWNGLIEFQEKISKIIYNCETNRFTYEENVQSRRTGTKKISRRRKEA